MRSANPDTLAAALDAGGLGPLHRDGDQISVSGASQQAIAELAFEHGVVYEISADACSLEDVFFALTTIAAEEALR